MPDIFSPAERSELMSKIHGKETKPEITVRKYLFSKGFRYRKNDKRYPGRPDIVLPKYRTAVFVNGCFWHGHEGCRAAGLPGTRREFWKKKIEANKQRDERKRRQLIDSGWKVITVWQCELKNKQERNERLKKLKDEITDSLSETPVPSSPKFKYRLISPPFKQSMGGLSH